MWDQLTGEPEIEADDVVAVLHQAVPNNGLTSSVKALATVL